MFAGMTARCVPTTLNPLITFHLDQHAIDIAECPPFWGVEPCCRRDQLARADVLPLSTDCVPLLGSIPTVIFECSSSSGRGPRYTGWYADVLEAAVGPENMAGRVKILGGGIKAWSAAQDQDGKSLEVLRVTG
jgi:hypothetical protein